MQAKQRRAFRRTRPASDDDNDAVVRLSRRNLDEVVAVTGEQQTTPLMSELKDEGVCGCLREDIAQAQGIRDRVLGVGMSGPRVRHGRAGTSRLLVRHLSHHQQINFAPMILVVARHSYSEPVSASEDTLPRVCQRFLRSAEGR